MNNLRLNATILGTMDNYGKTAVVRESLSWDYTRYFFGWRFMSTYTQIYGEELVTNILKRTCTTPIDDKLFVDLDTDRCPYCLSDNVRWDDIEIDSQEATQEIVCRSCGKHWLAVYKLDSWREYA